MKTKKVTGFKLIKHEYEAPALLIANQNRPVIEKWGKDIDVTEGSDFYINLKEAGVLDLWFHKVEVKIYV